VGGGVFFRKFLNRYLVLDGVREVVMALHTSHVLPLSFVLLCILPISLLHGGIIYWIFAALADTICMLEAKQQTEKLELFLRLWKVSGFVTGFREGTALSHSNNVLSECLFHPLRIPIRISISIPTPVVTTARRCPWRWV